MKRAMREIRDLEIEVIGGTYPDAYLYVGSGDHCVLLADHGAPKWRNAVGLTPENARKLAAALSRMADQSERPDPDDADQSDLTRRLVVTSDVATDLFLGGRVDELDTTESQEYPAPTPTVDVAEGRKLLAAMRDGGREYRAAIIWFEANAPALLDAAEERDRLRFGVATLLESLDAQMLFTDRDRLSAIPVKVQDYLRALLNGADQ